MNTDWRDFLIGRSGKTSLVPWPESSMRSAGKGANGWVERKEPVEEQWREYQEEQFLHCRLSVAFPADLQRLAKSELQSVSFPCSYRRSDLLCGASALGIECGKSTVPH